MLLNLSSSVIETLEIDENPCAFFLFDSRDGQEHLQTCHSLICSITYQLCSKHNVFTDVIMKTYSSCGSGTTPPSHPSLKKILIDTIQHLSSVFIVIDALDECHEIVQVGSWLQNLA